MKITSYLSLLTAMILFTSCSLSKSNKIYRNNIDGSWVVSEMNYEDNEGYFKSVLFDDVKLPCFKNSEWFFRKNNSTGSYTIVRPDDYCSAGERRIRWSVAEVDEVPTYLQFKFIDEKNKDLNDGKGYQLKISTLSESSMVLRSDVTVDGESLTIVYNFTRKTL